jgi:glucoamylase
MLRNIVTFNKPWHRRAKLASFFARSVQLQCFQAITANTAGIAVPAWLPAAISWLQNALASHWNGQYYQSILPVPADYRAPYDPNIDIVMAASVYLAGSSPSNDNIWALVSS